MPRYEIVTDSKPDRPAPRVVRLKLEHDGDGVDLVAVDEAGKRVAYILSLTSSGGLYRYGFMECSGLRADAAGRIKLEE